MAEISSTSLPPGTSIKRETDLLIVRVDGDYTLDVAVQVGEQNKRSVAEFGYQLNLIDFHRYKTITPDARRYVFQKPEKASFPSATAIIGASFPVRTLVGMLLRALRTLSNSKVTIEFFADEMAARAWIDTQRIRFQGGSIRPPP